MHDIMAVNVADQLDFTGSDHAAQLIWQHYAKMCLMCLPVA